jgi:1-phosphofructokinase
MVKVNGHELGEALGRAIETPADAAAAARATTARGPRSVVVTLGRQGAVAVDARGAWWASPPSIAPVSPVGSGDTLLAGLATALLRGEPLPDALRLGVACGTANALVLGAGVMRTDDITRVHADVVLRQL